MNQGPLDLQSNALPLSYTPTYMYSFINTFSPTAPRRATCPHVSVFSACPGGGQSSHSSPLSSPLLQPSLVPLQPSSSSGCGNGPRLYTWEGHLSLSQCFYLSQHILLRTVAVSCGSSVTLPLSAGRALSPSQGLRKGAFVLLIHSFSHPTDTEHVRHQVLSFTVRTQRLKTLSWLLKGS